MTTQSKLRHLVIVLGDQLDHHSAAFDHFDAHCDAVWMAEVAQEATYVWSHKVRLTLFFSAMRHFRYELEERGIPVHYHALTPDKSRDRGADFAEILQADITRLQPQKLIITEPGDWRVQDMLQQTAKQLNKQLEIRPDRHFYGSIEDFRVWSKDHRGLLLEAFYRHMRKTHGVLVDEQDKPVGKRWNFDKDNRASFGKNGPDLGKSPRSFTPDDITQAVMSLVAQRFANHPGRLENFDLPVTHAQGRALLRDFIQHRLADFGRFEDAMWTGQPFLAHSRLSAALNLHLLNPRELVEAALAAYQAAEAPLNSVEGFVRQILGWREYIRGVYWLHMPSYADRNALHNDDVDVPNFFWDGHTDMRCVSETMQSILDFAYTHHIQRLMVMGLFAQLYGVHPKRFHDWHMAMYADAVDWVSLPNALGMSQYGDGGIVGTKPYCASGNYINKMSNYCKHCRYDHREAAGESACPFTTLYWDFLARHQQQFKHNSRMNLQIRNLENKSKDDIKAIRKRADLLKQRIANGQRV
jgi:deoxyribodipyrimidine photolyase-related protein